METFEREQLSHLGTTELLSHALREARLLARAEVLHARAEAKEELARAKVLAVWGAATATFGLAFIVLLGVALALALPWAGWVAALVVGGGFLVLAGVCAWALFRLLPDGVMVRTRTRVDKYLDLPQRVSEEALS